MPLLHSILSKLHEIPIVGYVIIIAVSLALWTGLAFLLSKRLFWKWLNIAMLSITVIVVIMITLVLRETADKGLSLMPFSVLELAKVYPDVYQEMMLNVILFLPIGMTIPFVFGDRVKYIILLTVGLSVLLSVLIEVLQFVLMRGYAEIDDVICNTIGGCLGVLPFCCIRVFLRGDLCRKKSQ